MLPINLNAQMAVNSKETIHAGSWMSLIAYYPANLVNEELRGHLGVLENVSHIRPIGDTKTDTELYIFSKNDSPESASSGVVAVGIRGSEPSSLRDWLFTDFRFSHRPAFGDGKEGRNLHQGFYEALESVWDELYIELKSRCKEFKKFKLLVCGHSLGGALAVLVAAKLQHLYETTRSKKEKALLATILKNIIVQTFGQPRVGNKAFCEWYDKSLKSVTIRHIYGMDVVPRVPPEKGVWFKEKNKDDWRHCGKQVHYSKKGMKTPDKEVLKFSDLFFNGVKKPLTIRRALHNHVPWAYLWLAEGLITGEPNMFRPIEELGFFAKFTGMAKKRILRFYVNILPLPE